MAYSMGIALKNELQNRIFKAIDEISADEDFWEQLDMYVGEETISLAAEAAVSVIAAVSEFQVYAKREKFLED